MFDKRLMALCPGSRRTIAGNIILQLLELCLSTVMTAIEALTKEKTIIMIAHRLKTVRHADQIFVIDDGHIAQKGTHDDLMKQEGIYKSFVEGRQEAASWKIAPAAS